MGGNNKTAKFDIQLSHIMPYQTKKRGLLVLLLVCSLFTFSQGQDLDSIQNKLDTYLTRDSVRVHLLISAARTMMYINPEGAFKHVEEAFDISSQINWQKGKALILQQKGNLYYVMADNLQAMDAYQKALKISQTLNNKILEAGLYSNLGNIHADLKENEKALKKYHAYLAIAKELNQKPDQVKALVNMALVYNDMGRFNEGIAYLEDALFLARAEKNDFFIAAILNNLGLAHKGQQDYKKSLSYYNDAAKLAEKLENKYIEASALNSIGKVNILLKNYEVAGLNSEKALRLAQEVDAVEWQADSWQVLSTVYEHEGKTGEALSAYKNHIQFRDSVLNEEKKAELIRKEMQFQLERQESEAKSEIQQQTLIKNIFMVGGLLLIVASAIGYFLYKRKRDATEEKKIADFNTKVAETELKALRSQINPHFIFNSLNSISDFISKNNIEKANEYLFKFAKLTRSILENSEKKWIPLEEDLELIELYIQIEALRLKNKLSYAIKIDKAIDRENTLLPPLMLQPFIENSIWHGIAKKTSKGHIEIEIKKEGDMIVCIVDDDGVGRKKTIDVKKETYSMGVKITKNRLDIINQLRKVKGSLAMFDKGQGLRVELRLPLELQF